MVVELTTFAVLSILWLSLHGRVVRLPNNDVYHVSAAKQAENKARFYYLSVWTALIAAFLTSRTLEALDAVSFSTPAQRIWATGVLRGCELWSLLVMGGVWGLVGKRVSKPNSDGRSLLSVPAAEQHNDPKRPR